MAAVESTTQKLDNLNLNSPAEDTPSTTATTETAGTSVNADDVSPTVLNPSVDFSVIHPLSSSWTMWYIKPPTAGKGDWSDLLTEVVTFSSIEEFWGAYNNLPKVSELPMRSDYALFKTGIRPEWEDKANSKGGKIVYPFRDNSSRGSNNNSGTSRVDEIWLNILVGLLGGTLDVTNDPEVPVSEQKINGVFVNVRKAAIRFNLWTKDVEVDALKPIANRFKGLLKISVDDELELSPHDSSSRTKHTV